MLGPAVFEFGIPLVIVGPIICQGEGPPLPRGNMIKRGVKLLLEMMQLTV